MFNTVHIACGLCAHNRWVASSGDDGFVTIQSLVLRYLSSATGAGLTTSCARCQWVEATVHLIDSWSSSSSSSLTNFIATQVQVLKKTSGLLCVTCCTSVNATVAGGVHCRMIYWTVPSSDFSARLNECLQWRQWRDRRRQHFPDFCSGDGENTSSSILHLQTATDQATDHRLISGNLGWGTSYDQRWTGQFR